VKAKTGCGCELMVEEMAEADEVVLAPGSGAIYGRFQDRHLADGCFGGDYLKRLDRYRFWADL